MSLNRASAIDWKFWLGWTAANAIAFPVGWFISLNLHEVPILSLISPGQFAWNVVGALCGAIIGLAQWLILRQKIVGASVWILATSFGMAGSFTISWYTAMLWWPIGLGVVFGLTTGATQGIVLLLKDFSRFGRWLGVNTIGMAIGYAVALLVFRTTIVNGLGDVEFSFLWFCGMFIAGSISGAISGGALLFLLRQVNSDRQVP